ncbi:MAG: NAD(P)/FAD-dependent oxidoreductase, partial [Candidatus Dormibacteraeota bacterium]|nr:NAD(P)/FAD-dependent oxidoreductase [Candidatus Dormibacteraeota bacterium]
MSRPDVVIIGAGHNGLIAACYLARAGLEVEVLEGLDRAGGGSRTEETIPDRRFDLHSVAHNMLNMTDIPEDLDLAGAGLVYEEMDPFSVAIHADGRRVRFYRSVEATVASIAAHDHREADAYATFIERALPIVRAILPSIRGESSVGAAPGRLLNLAQALRHGAVPATQDVFSPYGSVLRRRLSSDLTRGPVAAFAAHAAVGPGVPGGGMFAFWQAAYHLFGQWHARGGAQGLTDALLRRLESFGGRVRVSAPVARIAAPHGRVERLILEDGETIEAATVIAAINPQSSLLGLLDPPLTGRVGSDLAAVRRGNVVQALIHVALDRLPQYPGGEPGDFHGLQSYVDRLDELERGWAAADRGELPDPLPLYAFTPSAIDDTLAPPGKHTMYLACPAAPSQVQGGWGARREEFVERALDTVEARAPGFRASITGVATRLPDAMDAERWPGGHPMHIDIALD